MFKRNGYYTNISTDENKNLVIVLNQENLDEAKEVMILDEEGINVSIVNPDYALMILVEDHLENGLDWIKPEEIGALTDAPIFSDSASYDDEGELIDCKYVWWFPDYQIKDPVKELLENSKVVFTYQKD